VKDINHLVQQFTHEVGQSRQAFANMQAVTEQVTQAGQHVKQANDDIFQAVQSTLIATQEISRETENTVLRARITQEQAAKMGELSRILTSMVEFFQLSSTVTVEETAQSTDNPALPLAGKSLMAVSAEV
jgi:twitching motility protein PilJ